MTDNKFCSQKERLGRCYKIVQEVQGMVAELKPLLFLQVSAGKPEHARHTCLVKMAEVSNVTMAASNIII